MNLVLALLEQALDLGRRQRLQTGVLGSYNETVNTIVHARTTFINDDPLLSDNFAEMPNWVRLY